MAGISCSTTMKSLPRQQQQRPWQHQQRQHQQLLQLLQQHCFGCLQEVHRDQAVVIQLLGCSHNFRLCVRCATRQIQVHRDRSDLTDGAGLAPCLPSQCPECGLTFQDGDFTILSCPRGETDVDCNILESNYHHSEDPHLSSEEWTQQQTSLLLPVIRVFNSTASPSASLPPSPPPVTRERFRYDSGIDMHLSREISVEAEDISVLLQIRMATAEHRFEREIQAKDKVIAALRVQVAELERRLYVNNAELKERDLRLHSLSHNHTSYDGSMIWKIPQFSRRKADAENGKCTSMFSLPFYSAKFGYKMCLCLYIMGYGIGKGTHLSLFFVVMRGEFDNILQWPFTHKVTFKLINQAGGRDIVSTFQPDALSKSFQKPKSDMNVASGYPQFVSHIELERGEFIVDDAIFIKCSIDTSAIHHP